MQCIYLSCCALDSRFKPEISEFINNISKTWMRKDISVCSDVTTKVNQYALSVNVNPSDCTRGFVCSQNNIPLGISSKPYREQSGHPCSVLKPRYTNMPYEKSINTIPLALARLLGIAVVKTTKRWLRLGLPVGG